jgi:gluconate 2-dehydrogenase gamma chain
MNRRQSIKALGIGAVSSGLLLDACQAPVAKETPKTDGQEFGRQDFEIRRDKELAAATFFTAEEMASITILGDIILPKDERSGSASELGVPAFIEFIVKDEPEHQLPMRGGLRWLDVYCLNHYEHPFAACTPAQRLEVVDEIAYPFKQKPGMEQGVAFFNKMRELTAIGFFTSKDGIKDLGYMGNAPGKWEGVPADVLKLYGLEGV